MTSGPVPEWIRYEPQPDPTITPSFGLSIRSLAWIAVRNNGQEIWGSYSGRKAEVMVTGLYAQTLLDVVREWNRQHPDEAILIGTFEVGSGA